MSTEWRDILHLGGRPLPQPAERPDEGGEPGPRGGGFRRPRESLSKSPRAPGQGISASVLDRIDEATWERLEEALILADVGAPTTGKVVEQLEQEVGAGGPSDAGAVRQRLIEILAELSSTGERRIDLSADPAVLLMVGVNGTGKTTTIGKVAWHLSREMG